MKKTDIMIDVANIEQIQKIIRTAYESAERYVKEFEQNGWTADIAMFDNMKSLMKMIEEWSEEKNKYIIEVSDDKTINVETCWNIHRIVSSMFKNIDAIKSITKTLADKSGAEYEVMIEKLVEEIRSPLKWKPVEW